MHLVKLIKTASPMANGLAIGSIILLVAKIFIFNRIPEIVPGAFEFGVMSDAILTSVVASYVFYLLVVHLKEQTDKATVRPYIAKHAKRIVGDCEALLTAVSVASGSPLALNSTKESVERALKNIASNSSAPLILANLGRNATWPEFFSYRHIRTKSSCRKLLDQLLLLDAQLISQVVTIDDCSLFVQIERIVSAPLNNGNMTFLSSTFHGYIELCSKLDALIKSSELAHAS
jgi:hypothetical protein